jgi:hypothetical protein
MFVYWSEEIDVGLFQFMGAIKILQVLITHDERSTDHCLTERCYCSIVFKYNQVT